ncbi:universal stress protein [Halopiger aswanensis]|uniref:Nucleotide-binding universal stress UspA family protein n=1 Tax=Halopiger aswanensis TaxID=148449 RepID=A0A419WEB3_9EURY|nr:universal stress protein [Halopiger aswanensis]RKD93820.1 nucleotide-binding universal stress UspA family protein [Halopiger aswanensis]
MTVDDILVPVDGSDAATAAFDHALEIAADMGATLRVLHVADTAMPSLARLGSGVADALEAEGDEIIANARERAEERGIDVVTDVRRGEPREEIVAAAADADLVVMGAHGCHGIGEYVLGTTTDYVINVTETPVLSVRAAEGVTRSYPYEAILVPTDGSDHGTAAVRFAAQVAAHTGATLQLLYVIDELPEVEEPVSDEVAAELEENATAILEAATAAATETGLEEASITTTVSSGSVPHEIRTHADAEAVDLIAMGTHGHTGLDRHLLGSFTEQLLRSAPVPVLTVQRGDE